MHHLAAKTAIEVLLPMPNQKCHEAQTEAEYFTALSDAAARAIRPTIAQRLHAVARFLWPTRLAAMLAAAEARRKDKAGAAMLLRGDPRILRDMGIEPTPFGDLVLAHVEDQKPPVQAPAPKAAIRLLPRFAPQALPQAF